MSELKISIPIQIDTGNIEKLQASIDSIGKKLKLNIKNVSIDKTAIDSVNKAINSIKIQPIKLSVDTSELTKGATTRTGATTNQKLATYDIAKLEKQQREFVVTSGNAEKVIVSVKKQLSSLGEVGKVALDKAFVKGKESIRGFSVEVTKANGALEKLNFAKAKLKTDAGSMTTGFVQTPQSTEIDKAIQNNVKFAKSQERALEGIMTGGKQNLSVDKLSELNKVYDVAIAKVNQYSKATTQMTTKQEAELKQYVTNVRQAYAELKKPEKIQTPKPTETDKAIQANVRFAKSQERALEGIMVGGKQNLSPDKLSELNKVYDVAIAKVNQYSKAATQMTTKQEAELKQYIANVRQTYTKLGKPEKPEPKVIPDQKLALTGLSTQTNQITAINEQFKNMSTYTQSAEKSVNTLRASYANLTKTNLDYQKSKGTTDEVAKQQQLVKAQTQFNAVLKDTNKELKLSQQIDPTVQSKKLAEVSTYMQKNKKVAKEYASALAEINALYKKGDVGSLNKANKLFAELKANATEMGIAGQSAGEHFGKMFGKFTQWFGITRIILEVVQLFRQMITNIIEVDTAMTELKKVTDETSSAYTAFLENASERAKTLGSTIRDVVSATADFARMGYDIPEASQMADAALVFKNVGDGIRDMEQATGAIISPMKAFGLEASQSIDIVDKLNETANNFSVNSGDLAYGLQNAGAAFSAAGMDIDQSIAVLTATNEIMQDMSKTSTALRTVATRIRNTSGQLIEMGEDAEFAAESTTKLQQQILSLTGVDIMLDPDTFRGTYDILRDIASVWNDITDKEKADVIRLLGGTRQAAPLNALLRQFSTAESVLEASRDSAGSALKENERVLDSIQGRLNILTSSFQALSLSFIDTDAVKGFISSLTTMVDLINEFVKTFGTIPTILTAVTAGLSLSGKGKGGLLQPFTFFENLIKNKSLQKATKLQFDIDTKALTKFQAIIDGKLPRSLKTMDGLFKGTSREAQQFAIQMNKGEKNVSGFANSTRTSTTAVKGIGVASKIAAVGVGILNTALTFGISLAIQAIVTAVTDWVQANEKLRESASEAADELKNEINSIEDYESRTAELIQSLNSGTLSYEEAYNARKQLSSIQDEIVGKYGTEAFSIDLTTASVEQQTEAYEKLRTAKLQQFQDENFAAIKQAEEFFAKEQTYTLNLSTEKFAKFGEFGKETINSMLEQFGADFKGIPIPGIGDILEFDAQNVNEYIQQLETIYDYLKNINGTEEEIAIAETIRSDISKEIKKLKNEEYTQNENILKQIIEQTIKENKYTLEGYDNLKKAQKEYREAEDRYRKTSSKEDKKARDESLRKYSQSAKFALETIAMLPAGLQPIAEAFMKDIFAVDEFQMKELDFSNIIQGDEALRKYAETLGDVDEKSIEASEAYQILANKGAELGLSTEQVNKVLTELGYIAKTTSTDLSDLERAMGLLKDESGKLTVDYENLTKEKYNLIRASLEEKATTLALVRERAIASGATQEQVDKINKEIDALNALNDEITTTSEVFSRAYKLLKGDADPFGQLPETLKILDERLKEGSTNTYAFRQAFSEIFDPAFLADADAMEQAISDLSSLFVDGVPNFDTFIKKFEEFGFVKKEVTETGDLKLEFNIQDMEDASKQLGWTEQTLGGVLGYLERFVDIDISHLTDQINDEQSAVEQQDKALRDYYSFLETFSEFEVSDLGFKNLAGFIDNAKKNTDELAKSLLNLSNISPPVQTPPSGGSGGGGVPPKSSGTQSFQGGKALVGELGAELVIEPSGKQYLVGTKGAEIVTIPEGSGIVPADLTAQTYTRGLPNFASGTPFDAFNIKPQISGGGIVQRPSSSRGSSKKPSTISGNNQTEQSIKDIEKATKDAIQAADDLINKYKQLSSTAATLADEFYKKGNFEQYAEQIAIQYTNAGIQVEKIQEKMNLLLAQGYEQDSEEYQKALEDKIKAIQELEKVQIDFIEREIKRTKQLGETAISLLTEYIKRGQTASAEAEFFRQFTLANNEIQVAQDKINMLLQQGYKEDSEEYQKALQEKIDAIQRWDKIQQELHDRQISFIKQDVETASTAAQEALRNKDFAKANKERLEQYRKLGIAVVAWQNKLNLLLQQGYAKDSEEYQKALQEKMQATMDLDDALRDELLDALDKQTREIEDADAKKQKIYDGEIDRIEALIRLENSRYNLQRKLKEEQFDIANQLKKAKELFPTMTEGERASLFNEEEFRKLNNELGAMNEETQKLYENYRKDIESLADDEIYRAEFITAEFDRQLAVKEKQYEILKQEVSLQNAQAKLINIQNQKTWRILENGQWKWIANQDELQGALDEVAQAEKDRALAVDDLSHQIRINELEAQKDRLRTQKEISTKETNALKDNLDLIRKAFEEPTRAISDILDDIARFGTPRLKDIINSISDSLGVLREIINENNSTIVSNLGNPTEAITETPSSEYRKKIGYGYTGQSFDNGGVAQGKGFLFKDTDSPEGVLNPNIMKDILNPEKNNLFDKFVNNIKGIMNNPLNNLSNISNFSTKETKISYEIAGGIHITEPVGSAIDLAKQLQNLPNLARQNLTK